MYVVDKGTVPGVDVCHEMLFHGRCDHTFTSRDITGVCRSVRRIPNLTEASDSKVIGRSELIATREFVDAIASTGADFGVREARITKAYDLSFEPGNDEYRAVPGYEDASEAAFDQGNEVLMDLFESHRSVQPPDLTLYSLQLPRLWRIRELHDLPSSREWHVHSKDGRHRSILPVEFVPGLIEVHPLIATGVLQMRDDVFQACWPLMDHNFWWHAYVNDRDLDDPSNPFVRSNGDGTR